jgi:hypothetical protein
MKNHSQIVLLAVCLYVLFLNLNCKKDNPIAPPDNIFALTVDDVSCTEVYLSLKIGTGISSRTVTLKRDTITLFTKTIDAAETVITDTSLLPNHTYSYTVALLNSSLASNSTARTMDTTSHAFSWQTFTLGDGTGSSVLYDVAIINDTLTYAVGAVYQSGSVYNLAKWNGQTWNLQQLLIQGSPPVIHSVFATNDHDVWLDPWFHWNGQSFQEFSIDPVFIGVGINKMWGNASDMYVVGNNGFIAHYNGSSWTKIESGTSLDVRDIFGAQITNAGAWEIFATAGNPLISPDRAILQINGNTAQAISGTGISWALNGIWFSPGQYYWLVGDGEWEKHPTLNASSWRSQALTTYTIDAVRGNGSNDVFMCGAFGEFLHFNGITWKSYIAQTGMDGSYLALAARGNTVIAVGEQSPLAIILMGKRQ